MGTTYKLKPSPSTRLESRNVSPFPWRHQLRPRFHIRFLCGSVLNKKSQSHQQQAVSFQGNNNIHTFVFCCTPFSALPICHSTQHMFISIGNSYSLVTHITCSIYNKFPLSSSSSTPISHIIQHTLHIMTMTQLLPVYLWACSTKLTPTVLFTTIWHHWCMPPLSCPFNAVSHTGTDLHTSSKGCKPYITSVIDSHSPTAHSVIMWGI